MSPVRVLLYGCLLFPCACKAPGQGDDLPPGAFTSGPDDSSDSGSESSSAVPTTSATSTGNPSTGDSTTAASASETASSTSGGMIPDNLNYDEHIAPIWAANCIDAGCHDADTVAGGLDLISGDVYFETCNGTHTFSGMPYIDCARGDPQNSYIFRKIEGTHLDGDISGGNGSPMPLAPVDPLSATEVTIIEMWIAEGAVQSSR